MMKASPMFDEMIQPGKATVPLALTTAEGAIVHLAAVHGLLVAEHVGAAAEAGALPVSVHAAAVAAVVAFAG
jgi:hypothetical protein